MNSRGIIVLSLALNMALIGAVAYLIKGRPAGGDVPKTAVEPAKTKVVERKVVSTVTNTLVETIDWRKVEHEDYKKYIGNLRSIGCPEETIRDIIVADVNKLYDAKKRELKSASTNKFEYWKSGNFFASIADPEKIQKQQELNKEKRALLKELLGIEPDEKPDLTAAMNPFESMLDFLSSSKQAQIMEVMQKYQGKMMKGFSGGAPDAEDMKNMQKTQKEMEAEMARIMTPQEFDDYQLRMSQTAMVMRMQLSTFDPNEQEFKDIFRLRKKFEDDFGLMGMASTDKAEKEKRDEAQKEMKEQLKTILGQDRYAEYERGQDFVYQGIAKVAQRNNLSKDSAVKVYDMKKEAEAQAKKVREDKALSSEQRQAALQAIRAETENSVKAVFGDKAYESYKNQPNAYWINGLSPTSK